jgi:N-acetylglucosaminyldiphosphoundecaprenol N-acetyl-beta-D-mannosaminyltransferase
MELIAAILAVAAVVWGIVFARRGSLWLGCAAFITLGYVLGPPLWSPKLGPVPLTIDRLLLSALIAAYLWHWRTGRLGGGHWTAADWLLMATLVYFTVRCAATPAPLVLGSSVKPWWRLMAAFWAPAALYLVARTAPLTEKSWRGVLWSLTALGAFLSFTAFAEITRQWWAVFPRYIANPELGTHFGRARGPALNSASLGIMLTMCFWALWMLWPKLARPCQVLAVALLGAMVAAVYFTYTRSTWIGLAASLTFVPLLQWPRQWRPLLLGGILMVGALGACALGDRVTNLARHDSDESAEHSVQQRESFLYVSMRMWRDAPVFGCGFGRFYDLKLPYLADRSQQVELDSLRELDHHNTLLSVLVETGFVGFTLFTALLATWTWSAWRLVRGSAAEPWRRAQGLFGLAVMAAYLSSALFHDLTLMPTEHWLLFLSTGMSVGLLANRPTLTTAETRAGSMDLAWSSLSLQPISTRSPSSETSEGSRPKTPAIVPLFGMSINALTMRETVGAILAWCGEPRSAACRYIVTPNADHAVMFQTNSRLRDAYAHAALVLADGAPIVVAARLLAKIIPERVPGSDLAPALFKAVSKGASPLRVFLLGAATGVAERAAANIARQWRHVEIVGTLSPPPGFERDERENERILAAISKVKPDLLIVGLGAPKQELWARAHAERLEAKVALCIGATIDFLAGEKRRAPRWMRRAGLEWLHRVATEPGRLAKRYIRDAWVLPQLIWREWRRHEVGF